MEPSELNLSELGKVSGGTNAECGPAIKAFHDFNVRMLEKYGKSASWRSLTEEEYAQWQLLHKAAVEEGDRRGAMSYSD